MEKHYATAGLWAILILLLLAACTPKTSEPITAEKQKVTKPSPPKQEEKLSPCPKFRDAPNPDDAETNYVLYRDFLRAGDWTKAFEFWEKVYAVSPAADGRRNTVYADGIRFYEYFMSQTQDSLQQSAYVDTIFNIYDEIDRCYGEGGYIQGRKAFDLFYKYQDRASKEEIYGLFKTTLDIDSLDAPDFVVNPMASLLVELYDQGKISQQEAYRYQELLRGMIEKGLAECEGTGCERWKIIEEYAPVRLEYFETVKGFYPCDYYMQRYYADFEADPTNCDVVRTVYSRLKFAECSTEDERMKELIRIGNENCRPEPGPAEVAYNHLRDAEYQKAITAFEKAIEAEEEVEKKAKYALTNAKIYEIHLRNFPKAREWATRAADIRSNWGEPYILIGRLYASSGPLCGPGRGWDSQIVTWPAIDAWQKAKQVDPSVRAEADKFIGRYQQYMPNREDVFQRNLKAGESFYVGCWIQRSTVIRTAD